MNCSEAGSKARVLTLFRRTARRKEPGALAHAKFDVVVLDLFLPDASGLDIIKLFHACNPTVPLIAISGHVFADHPFPDQFRKLALEMGAARCLPKPLTVSVLVREIRTLLPQTARISDGPEAGLGGGSAGAAEED